MKESTDIKFLGLELDKFMNQKHHIEKVLSKMSSACYTDLCTILTVWLCSRWFILLTFAQ